MWESDAWKEYVAGYDTEAKKQEDALLAHPSQGGFKRDDRGRIIFEDGKPLFEVQEDSERVRIGGDYDKALASLAGAKLFRSALFPDNCAKRGLFASMNEPRKAFIGGGREPLTKAYLAQFGRDIRSFKKRCLMFCGNVGTGKTYAAAAVSQVLCMSGVSCKYILLPELLERMRRATSFSSRRSIASVLYDALNARFLVLDEVGRALNADSSGLLFLLFNELWTGPYSFICTTNFAMNDFIKSMDVAILDRIRDWGEFVSFEGKSYRGQNKEVA